MKKLFSLMLLISCFAMDIMAQDAAPTFVLKGIVADSVTNEGEPYATITVARAETPGNAVKRMVTNANGKFSEKVTGTGDFVVTVSSVGRGVISKKVHVDKGEGTVDLGKVLISDHKNELSGVEVVAKKPLVKADIDKIEYNIEDDPDSKTNTVMNMLRKIPMVTVDGQDNIKVKGSSSFKIYVNGKPNNMMTNNPKEVLKSMPATGIKKIEVITNPGPKYDAEGVGGIINIITLGTGFEGYTATFTGRGGSTSAGGGAFATAKVGKFTISANYNYDYSFYIHGYNGSSSTVKGDNPSPMSANMALLNESRNWANTHSGSIEASYEIDTLRLITMSFDVWGQATRYWSNSFADGTSPLTGGSLYDYDMYSKGKNHYLSLNAGLDYQRMFKLKGRMLTFSYRINTNPYNTESYSDYSKISAVEDWADLVSRMKDMYEDMDQRSAEHTFQVDYTTPMGKVHKLETGVKYILRNYKADNDRNTRPNDSTGGYVFDADQSSHYRHQNDILAAYMGYGLNLKKLSGRLGLRYEHTIQDVEYLLGRGDDFRKHFNDFVPSASIGYKLTDTQNLSLSYNMRIYRPSIWYLNPYLNDSDPTSISRGNPDLDSDKSHSLSLGYNSFTNKLQLYFSAGYTFSNNSIQGVTTLVPDNSIPGLQNPTGKDVLYTTYKNIGKNRAFTLNAYANWSVTPSTRIYANVYPFWQSMSNGADISNHGWTFTANGGIQQNLPKDWVISLGGYVQSRQIQLQGRSGAGLYYWLNINKSFLKKRLTISVYANNFFRKWQMYNSNTDMPDFVQKSWSKFTNQSFGVNVSFRIGELNATVKKVERTIVNDDVKSGGKK